MDFNSVEQVLKQLEKQPGWEHFRAYRQLLNAWHNSVNKNTVNHTRPLYIKRQVLWVATNSASRAQELSFQRYGLLKKLNQQLPFVLKDIRFSSSGYTTTNNTENIRQILFTVSQQQKPPKSKSSLRNSLTPRRNIEDVKNNHSSSEKAKIAAKRWLAAIEENIQNPALSPCPNCQAATPTGELKRWNSCYVCVAQKWAKEYQMPSSTKSE